MTHDYRLNVMTDGVWAEHAYLVPGRRRFLVRDERETASRSVFSVSDKMTASKFWRDLLAEIYQSDYIKCFDL